MSFNFKSGNILRPDLWTTGSGSITPSSGPSFGQNGLTVENERVNDTNPFGRTSVVWETRSTGGNNDDGGWNTGSFSIDDTKTYRFSVWVRRTSSSSTGTFYLGTGDDVKSVSDDVTRGDPYWECTGTGNLTQNQWYLVVGHIFPYNYALTTNHVNTGYYTVTGGKVGNVGFCNIGSDLKWISGRASTIHRTYHYYCTDGTTKLQFFDPRVDLCDGTEPTITELLEGNTTDTGIELNSRTITVEGASFKNQKVVATGGDAITYNGQWKIHRFNAGGTFVVTSFIGASLSIDYLIGGGGGGGGTNMGGGGGGGGVITGSTTLLVGTYSITVGGGGTGAPAGTGGHPTVVGSNGGNSTFNGLTAYGGGYGGISYNSLGLTVGNSGGSGGGTSGYNDNGAAPGVNGSGAGTAGQGYRGGYQGNAYYAGGGGGAGGAGADGNNKANGGVGKYSNILGRPYYFGGGGGGASYSIPGGDGGIGGGGGGAMGYPAGNGGQQSVAWGVVGQGTCINCQDNKPGGNGGTNSGGGGGGGSHYNYTNAGGNGGSGIVVIRYKYK